MRLRPSNKILKILGVSERGAGYMRWGGGVQYYAASIHVQPFQPM